MRLGLIRGIVDVIDRRNTMKVLLPFLLIAGLAGCGTQIEPAAAPRDSDSHQAVASAPMPTAVEQPDEPGPEPVVPADNWLRVVGKEIRTAPGAVYYPAGEIFMGMGVAHPRTSQMPYGNDRAVARFIRERHCNILRITTGRPGHGGSADVEKFIASGDEQVRFCKQHRIYSILDWYHHSGYRWLIEDEKELLAWKDLWVRIATFYRDDPWVIFEILNEPVVDEEEWPKLRERIVECIAAIREVEGTRKHLVLVGGNRWCNSRHMDNSWDGFHPDPAGMTAIVFHDYSESSPEQTADNIDDFQQNNLIPVFGSEWGIKAGHKGAGIKECREQEIGMLDEVYIRRKISECFWSLSENGGYLEHPQDPWKTAGPGTPLHDCLPFSDIWIPRTIEHASRCTIVIHPELSVDTDQVKADGTSGSTITLEVKDQDNRRIEYNNRAKDRVEFTTSRGNLEGTNPARDLNAGTAKVVLKSAAPGTAEVTASYTWNAALWQYTTVDGYVSKPSFGYWKAVDGRIASEGRTARDGFRVSASKSWRAEGPGPHWLVVDLGAPYSVERFVVHHDGADTAGGDPKHNTSDYQIQRGSKLDGPWEDLARATGNADSTTTHTIAPTKMRYVRLHITRGSRSDDPTARICEFEVFAVARASVQVQLGKTADRSR